jgi:hypothetical protein
MTVNGASPPSPSLFPLSHPGREGGGEWSHPVSPSHQIWLRTGSTNPQASIIFIFTTLNLKERKPESKRIVWSCFAGERKYHAFVPFVIATLALGSMSALIDTNPATAFLAMLCATVLWGPAGIISALPATFLSGPAAAMGVAIINSIANLGGILGPFMIGKLCHLRRILEFPIPCGPIQVNRLVERCVMLYMHCPWRLVVTGPPFSLFPLFPFLFPFPSSTLNCL